MSINGLLGAAYRPLLLGAMITTALGFSACGGSGNSHSANVAAPTPTPTSTPTVTPTPVASPTPTPAATPTPVASPTPTAGNSAPVANAGVDKNVRTGSAVTLDASGSSDADGDSLTYTWAIVALPASSNAVLSSSAVIKPTFTADLAGIYTFQVSVSDGTATATDQVMVTVTAATATGTDTTAGVLCDWSQNVVNTINNADSMTATSTATWSCTGTARELTANGLPDHPVGDFPNGGNPNEIAEQTVSGSFTLMPISTSNATTLGGPAGVAGYVLNGVKIDAGTAGSCDDSGSSCSLVDNSGGWSIEALGQSHFDFGTDNNNAHVQPGGVYHYHGMPEGFITLQGGNSSKMTLIGWAADGFPIYARYGYSEANNASSAVKKMTGSYQLVTTVSHSRPATGTYALGTFSQDWEYVAGSGDLDQCNGRFGVTPEFPNGIYHYYATDSYPYLQRCVTGAVEAAAGGLGGAGGPPAGGPPPR